MAEEAAILYNLMRKSEIHNIDHEVHPKNWLQPDDSVRITEQKGENAIKLYTDTSKSEQGV